MIRINWKLALLPTAWVFLKSKKNEDTVHQKRHYLVQLLSAKFTVKTLIPYHHICTTIHAKAITENEIILEADDIYSRSEQPDALYQYLKPYNNTNNADILWRLARAARDKALKDKSVSADEKKTLTYEAFEFSKRALEVDDNNFGAHKWFAITIGDVGDYEGTKAKIANAFLIRDHLERAVHLNPKDPTSFHCLGMWCFTFAEMPWYQRKIAGVLFTSPPTSTYKEALEYFKKAEAVEPNFYSCNLLMIGKCYAQLQAPRHAMLYLDKAIKYPKKNEEDEQAAKEAGEILQKVIEENKNSQTK